MTHSIIGARIYPRQKSTQKSFFFLDKTTFSKVSHCELLNPERHVRLKKKNPNSLATLKEIEVMGELNDEEKKKEKAREPAGY